MITRLEKYRFVGELHRQALHQLPESAELSAKDKDQLRKWARYGWWLGVGVQFPVILSATWVLDKTLNHIKGEKKIAIYITGAWAYGMFFMLSKAWAWHYAFRRVEPIIKDFILNADIEEIKKIQREKELGIFADKNKVYLPKD